MGSTAWMAKELSWQKLWKQATYVVLLSIEFSLASSIRELNFRSKSRAAALADIPQVNLTPA
jgi:hypothetical protein